MTIDIILKAAAFARGQAKSQAFHYRPTVGSTKQDVKTTWKLTDDLADKVTKFGWFNTPFTFDGIDITYDWYKANKL